MFVGGSFHKTNSSTVLTGKHIFEKRYGGMVDRMFRTHESIRLGAYSYVNVYPMERQASNGERRGGSDLQKSLCNTSQLYIRPQTDRKPKDL